MLLEGVGRGRGEGGEGTESKNEKVVGYLSLRVRGCGQELGKRGQGATCWDRERDIWHERESRPRPILLDPDLPSPSTQSKRTHTHTHSLFQTSPRCYRCALEWRLRDLRAPHMASVPPPLLHPEASPLCLLLIYVPCAYSGSPYDPGRDPEPAASPHGFVCFLACAVDGMSMGA